MDRLQGPLADLIEAERAGVEPAPDAKDRTWAGVAAGFGPPSGPPGAGGGGSGAAAASGGTLLKVVGAVVVGGVVAAGGWAGTRPGPSPTPVAAELAPRIEVSAIADPEPPQPKPRLPPKPASPPTAASRPESPPTSAVEVSPSARRSAKPRPASRPSRSAEPTPGSNAGLAQELKLIESLRRAVARRDYAEALRLAKEHRESFEGGALKADRLDLEASAECGRGRLERGRSLASRRAERWPKAPVSDRLRTLCELPSPNRPKAEDR